LHALLLYVIVKKKMVQTQEFTTDQLLKKLLQIREFLLEINYQQELLIPRIIDPINQQCVWNVKKDHRFQKVSLKDLFKETFQHTQHLQINVLEIQIQKIVEQTEVWQFFGRKVKGFGFLTCAYLIAYLQDPFRFKNKEHVKSYCGLISQDGTPKKRKKREKITYQLELKKVLCETFPEAFHKNTGKFPNTPYAKMFHKILNSEKQKAIGLDSESICKNLALPSGSVKKLGFENRRGKDVFLGFEIVHDNTTKKFLNPEHVQQRARHKFSQTFVCDFYQAWKFALSKKLCYIKNNQRILSLR
jgi:hypothetical protein